MSDTKVGVIIDDTAQRDAIHIAVAPVIAADHLKPGQAIGLLSGTIDRATFTAESIGIVDPFLSHQLQPGDRFWMFLYPQTVTGMRHHWNHPAFTESGPTPSAPVGDLRAHSEAWLREFAKSIDLDYDYVMDACRRNLESDYYHIFLNSTDRDTAADHVEEMWRHYEIVTGQRVEDHTATVFSCSC